MHPAHADFLWPLARGQNVQPFSLEDSGLYEIVAHDPDDLASVLTVDQLAGRAPRLFDFLEPWMARLAKRSPYQELQPSAERPWGIQGPWMHLSRTAPLVLCRYMHPQRKPPAAVALSRYEPKLGLVTTVYPNNKSDFVRAGSEDEAWYIAACVNAPCSQAALARFVSSTTIGPSALGRLPLPRFEPANPLHFQVVAQGRKLSGCLPQRDEMDELDALVRRTVEERY